MFKFETLEIWKETINFASQTYKKTKKFPSYENFGLISRLNRAAVSISLNIAEGTSRSSNTDFKRFIQMSIGSLNEVVSCLYIAKEQNYISNSTFDACYNKCEQISKMLYGFMKHLSSKYH